MKRFFLGVVPFAAVFAIAAGSAGSAPVMRVTGHTMAQNHQSLGPYQRACNEPVRFGYARCDVMYSTNKGLSHDVPNGWGAGDLETAYALPSSTNGAGQIVAVVDAFDDPNAVSDFNVYRSTYGLPSSTLLKYNQNGQQSNYPAANRGWALEESLDVDMMSAGCPLCTVILVEANGADYADLQTAVKTAANLGATVISNSYGGGGGASQSAYNIPGTTILASAGDSGYGVQDPADFPSVVAVGGTVLSHAQNSRGWSETVWNGTGSGCGNAADAKPKWQKAKWTPNCSNRVMNDVSAVATGVAVYDSYGYSGFITVAGTSISSPLIGSIFGLAGNANAQSGGSTFWKKKHSKLLNDVTSGSNGSCSVAYLCHGEVGYDGPTGWGTPEGIGAF